MRHGAGAGYSCLYSFFSPASGGRSLHSDPWRQGNRADEEAGTGASTTSGAKCARDSDSGSNNTNAARVETGAVTQHCTGDFQQPVGHRTYSQSMGVTAGAQHLILAAVDRVVLGGHARSVEGSLVQSAVGGLTPHLLSIIACRLIASRHFGNVA